ncbi:hypothetical protein GCM10008024_33040 [Allgaiera indica]|uniref:Cupredoxin-like domain-containing protein n=1 Tax=Allgaiera indica TaxID=765699 RepID=A0AAN4UU62_9RHOB|nr:cupredoxin domain-containing protein [Allgaiera indica]GHE04765.1 hypothetical protein GCM10008024_33040 [Allgaiera indica]SDX54735.1 Cupredoxin-like domain-containing protein [Allgaiera indica]
MPLTKRLGAAAALSIATLLAAGAVSAEQALVVTLHDGVVTPQKIEVPAGKAQVLTVKNTGKAAAEFESKRLRIEKIIAPGKTVEIKLRPLPAGTYPFVEEFHEDQPTARGEIVAK